MAGFVAFSKTVLKKTSAIQIYQWIYRFIVMPLRAVVQDAQVILGIISYWKYGSDDQVLLAKLRMTAHIIDKGLQYSGWNLGRSVGKYEICKRILNQLENSPVKGDPSYQWACGVVQKYEHAQQENEVATGEYFNPHVTHELQTSLRDIIMFRRSIRTYENRRIEKELLDKLIEVVNWCPVSCCRQPAVLHVTQNEVLVKKCLSQCIGATCFSEVNPPCFISVCADMRAYNTLDRHVGFIDVSLGVQNILLLAHTYGIEGVVLNWMQASPGQNKRFRALLTIPSYHRILFNLVLGYPAQCAPPPGRKSISETYVVHK